MCCGNASRSKAPIGTPDVVGTVEPLTAGNSVEMWYSGTRSGGFGVKGRGTGRRYRVPGTNGTFLVDKADVRFFKSFNRGRDFEEII